MTYLWNSKMFLSLLKLSFLLPYVFAVVVQLSPKMSSNSRRERSGEHRIKQRLLKNYDSTSRPVRNDSSVVSVHIAISLYHILDTNEREQTFTCLIAIRQKWKDEYLTWNASHFDGVKSIKVPSNKIWTPDLVIQNFAGDKFNDYMVTNAIVNDDGNVLWLLPALIKTYCTLNVKYFPFDTQKCEIIFISWTHSGNQLDVLYSPDFNNSVYYISKYQEWAVDKDTGITAKRQSKQYACCPELYPDVTFTIHMRRGSLFYVINLIAPCFLIFLISFLGFFLPVESGEKVNLEITILLALVVFLLRVGESMPPTPDSIPILGMFFASTMVMVSIALVMAVIVTNIYAKRDTLEKCPDWIIGLAVKCLNVEEFGDLEYWSIHQQPTEQQPESTAGHTPARTQNFSDFTSETGKLSTETHSHLPYHQRTIKQSTSGISFISSGGFSAGHTSNPIDFNFEGSAKNKSSLDSISSKIISGLERNFPSPPVKLGRYDKGLVQAQTPKIKEGRLFDAGDLRKSFKRSRKIESSEDPDLFQVQANVRSAAKTSYFIGGMRGKPGRNRWSTRKQNLVPLMNTRKEQRRPFWGISRSTDTESSEASQDRRDRERIKAEWRLAAMFADRIFLWIFVFISLITHSTLVLQMFY